MREIKFRAWNYDNKIMILENELTWIEFNNPIIIQYNDWEWLNYCRNYELMQYTWLKDKNWKEIYEWDVVKYEDKTRCKWDDLLINRITFNIPQHRYWIWKWINCEKDSSLFIYLTPKNCKKIEKIWNIYENPNLINQ